MTRRNGFPSTSTNSSRSIQGCQSRTVRDTAAFVDACRGPAPGEFMPFWSPPEPYTRERFDHTYQWTLGWGLVQSGATFENTVDNRAWQ